MKFIRIASKRLLLPLAVFVIAFAAIPFRQLNGFNLMPGDLVDPRLNNYFLENIYQFLIGHSPSLWQLQFYWPFPYIGGFSDNLFGAAPIYLVARLLTGKADTAYQLWYYFGYLVNYCAAYYSLRKLGIQNRGATLGAALYAFALPVGTQAGHAQLQYRFGLPLAMAYFGEFLQKKSWQNLAITTAWLVWDFYCAVYIGFFTLLMLISMLAVFLMHELGIRKTAIKTLLQDFFSGQGFSSRGEMTLIVAALLIMAGLIGILFYPYLKVSQLYGFTRDWETISSMMPQLQSYFFTSKSVIWGTERTANTTLVSGEQRIFVGAIPYLLAVIGLYYGLRDKTRQMFIMISGSLGLVILMTLNVNGYSLWYLIHTLPLVSAIRALGRVIMALLFPFAYLAGIAADGLHKNPRGKYLPLFVMLPLLLIEAASGIPLTSPKQQWRDRIHAMEAAIPANLRAGMVPFVAQPQDSVSYDLDVMWVALKRGITTMNGYSGNIPPQHLFHYGNDCAEIPRRILAYLQFSGKPNDPQAYLSISKQIKPLGFSGCDDAWFNSPQSITTTDRPYLAKLIKKLSYKSDGLVNTSKGQFLQFHILNPQRKAVPARSSISQPLRIAWRYLDSAGQPLTQWNDTRQPLDFDIPANGSLAAQIKLDPTLVRPGGAIEVTLVQEFAFWAQDIGLQPLSVQFNK